MIQEILTYIIIFAAVFYTIRNFISFLFPSKRKNKFICSKGCSSCAFAEDAELAAIKFKKLQ